MLPGNHDSRPEFRKVLLADSESDPDDAGPINQIFRVGHLAVLCCDSTIPGVPEGDGYLDAETLG